MPDLANAVDAPDLRAQCLVPTRTIRQPGWIRPLDQMIVVGGWGDRQHLADRLDPMRTAVRVNETHHYLDRRSSSAIAKYADAFLRISLAWRSSRFSRSSALAIVLGPMANNGSLFSAISLGIPARWPLFTSARLTQSFSVLGAQPIFAAIEVMAFQRDPPEDYMIGCHGQLGKVGEDVL
jgi:hypothetical protein